MSRVWRPVKCNKTQNVEKTQNETQSIASLQQIETIVATLY